MVRITFQEQPARRAIRTEDPGYIDLPETIYAYDIIADKKAKNEPIPSAMSQFLNRYNFYLALVPISAGINYNARGAKWISVKGQFASGVTAEDSGPKTEWIKAGEFEVNFGINFNTVGKLLELVNLPNPVDGSVAWKWTRHPHVATIVTGGAGRRVEWKFTAEPGKYVDGAHQAFTTLRAPRDIDGIYLEITDALAEYDIRGTDRQYVKNDVVRIKVETP
jgi:hypothetical protein